MIAPLVAAIRQVSQKRQRRAGTSRAKRKSGAVTAAFGRNM